MAGAWGAKLREQVSLWPEGGLPTRHKRHRSTRRLRRLLQQRGRLSSAPRPPRRNEPQHPKARPIQTGRSRCRRTLGAEGCTSCAITLGSRSCSEELRRLRAQGHRKTALLLPRGRTGARGYRRRSTGPRRGPRRSAVRRTRRSTPRSHAEGDRTFRSGRSHHQRGLLASAGNRTPTPQEAQVCRPFLERQLELVAPDVVLLLGGAAAKQVLDVADGIMRIRGKWRDVEIGGRRVRAMATLHPAYLLRTPAAKRQAWRDLMAVRAALDGKAF